MRATSLTLLLLGVATLQSHAEAPRNVLFIAADDLRCDLGCYGNAEVKTPHLDRLAAQGMRFDRAYCQQALCNPSRASLLTGLRPDRLKLWNLEKHFRDEIPDVVTLPQYFKGRGYHTQNVGKIFHNWRTEIQGDPLSWSVPAVMHFANHGHDKPQVEGSLPEDFASDRKCECRDVPDDAYFDGRVAELAIEALQQRKESGEPFFLAVGFWKPHSPFNAPKKYWDLYERENVSLPKNPKWPANAPEIAWHNSREILGEPARKLTEDAVREMRHGYLANISYLDAQVGKVLAELERLGLREQTAIVFWSDHGYHLGEQTLWAKTSNFELDARVPLILSVPGKKSGSTQSLVELLDLYPTLAELCGLPPARDLDGVSLTPILADPKAQVKRGALTQHPRPAYYGATMDAMGYSLRTDQYRYTEWVDPKTGQVLASELYDHEQDPEETVSIAGSQPSVAGELARQLELTLRGNKVDSGE